MAQFAIAPMDRRMALPIAIAKPAAMPAARRLSRGPVLTQTNSRLPSANQLPTRRPRASVALSAAIAEPR